MRMTPLGHILLKLVQPTLVSERLPAYSTTATELFCVADFAARQIGNTTLLRHSRVTDRLLVH